MYKNLRWKFSIIVAVIALAGVAMWQKKISLGLDLKGGVHLVLQVKTDDALKLETETAAEQFKVALKDAGITPNVHVTSLTEFAVDGVPPASDQQFRTIADQQLTQTYDRSGGGGSYTFRMKPNMVVTAREQTVTEAVQTIERRVNELGVSEPFVAPYGTSGDQIIVELPGLKDVAHAKEIIRNTAVLELRLVTAGPAPDEATLLAPYSGKVPPGQDVVHGTGSAAQAQAGTISYYLVEHVPAVTGRDLRNAKPSLDEYNAPAVSFTLNNAGVAKFSRVTAANVGKQLAILLDDNVQSAPVIEGAISTADARITGHFTSQEASDLALVLRSGALPASLSYLEEEEVGPTLGADSIHAGVLASAMGLAFVAAFMLFYYRLAGLNAVTSIVLNLVILLGFMAYLGAVMTLPGIAGFILTIGMGVDSNVLIFERVREELATNKGVRQALGAGFDRVFITIVDTHVSSLIAAAFLFQFGTGPIRGFATTLFFGLISNVFTAVFVSRTLFEFILSRKPAGATQLSI
jgi:preprotein translocase subunit SecD